jgi:hypothetical protein
MTGITNIRCGNMVNAFTASHRAVMTIKTGTHDLRMVDRNGRDRRPGRWKFLMTGIAHITRGNMRCALATGRYTIMASDTVTNKRRMINSSDGCPGISGMT